jgi:hypothetical protein
MTMTRAILVSVALAWLIVSTTAGQTRPDFSGTWRFDPNRSDSATYPELSRPVTLVITQTPTELRIETASARGKSEDVFTLQAAGDATMPGTGVARWRGDALVADSVRDVRGQSVTVHQTLTLNADGRELTIESAVNVQHGYSMSRGKVYGAGRDVFVRAPR